jgi:hypothetical protein
MECASESAAFNFNTYRHDESDLTCFRFRAGLDRFIATRHVPNGDRGIDHLTDTCGLGLRARGPGRPIRSRRTDETLVGGADRRVRAGNRVHRDPSEKAVFSGVGVLADDLFPGLRRDAIDLRVQGRPADNPYSADSLCAIHLAPSSHAEACRGDGRSGRGIAAAGVADLRSARKYTEWVTGQLVSLLSRSA